MLLSRNVIIGLAVLMLMAVVTVYISRINYPGVCLASRAIIQPTPPPKAKLPIWLRCQSPAGANRTPTWDHMSRDSLGCDPGIQGQWGLELSCRPAREMDARRVEAAREIHYNYRIKKEVECAKTRRVGNRWEICMAVPYVPTRHLCLIYSFGISEDWSFEEEMESLYGCSVMTFDPSLGIEDHDHSEAVRFFNLGIGDKNEENTELGWTTSTFGTILKKLGDENSIINVLKLDLRFMEWDTIDTMLQEGSLQNVKQIIIEVHSWRDTMQDYLYFHRILVGLHNAGFERWHTKDHTSHPSCFEAKGTRYCPQAYIGFINFKFLW